MARRRPPSLKSAAAARALGWIPAVGEALWIRELVAAYPGRVVSGMRSRWVLGWAHLPFGQRRSLTIESGSLLSSEGHLEWDYQEPRALRRVFVGRRAAPVDKRFAWVYYEDLAPAPEAS